MPSALAKIRLSWSKVKSPTPTATKETRDSSDSSTSPTTTAAVPTTAAAQPPTTMTQVDPQQAREQAAKHYQPLLGRVFAITGGASGIGFATAQILSQRGGAVCIADVDPEAMEAATTYFANKGVECDVQRVDVSKRKEVDAWIASIIAKHGRLDGAANVAGVIGKCHGISTVAELEDEDWDKIIGINLTGTMYCMRAQLRSISRGGSIVNVSSIHGLKGTYMGDCFFFSQPGCKRLTCGLTGFAKHAAYDASKHGIVGLTKAAALENGDHEIRVNSVAPGAIYTPLMQKNWDFNNRPADAPFDEPTAFQRQGTAEETANVICFLLGPESTFVSGSVYQVDGAWM